MPMNAGCDSLSTRLDKHSAGEKCLSELSLSAAIVS